MTEGSDLLRTFETELRQGAERIQSLLLEIESTSSSEKALADLREVYRMVHSIKGASRVVGLSNIEDIAHAMEDRLQNQLNAGRKPSQAETSVFLKVAEAFVAGFNAFLSGHTFEQGPFLDQLSSLEELQQQAAKVPTKTPSAQAPGPAQGEARPAPAREEYVTVPTHRLDELFRRVEEAFLIESRLTALIRDLDDRMNESANGHGALLWEKSLPNFLKEANRLHFVLMQFHELVGLFRMVPMRRVRVPLQKAVRDLTSTLGKPAKLHFLGAEQMVDASTLDKLQDPLMHLIRNAVDHGIEKTEDRQQKGKPPEGNLTIKTETKGGSLYIDVSDDGGGIDFQKIREKALEQKLVDPEECGSWTEAQWLELLFRPSFSTAAAITAVSGRGIGLDIVRARIKEIGGELNLSSAVGMGTTFHIQVPIGLLTPRVLLVRCGEQKASISASEIERVAPFRRANTEHVDGKLLVRINQIPIQVEPLARYLGWESAPIQTGHVIVVNVQGTLRGLLVDEILDEIEQVTFPPPWNLRGIPYLGGVIVLGNGTLVPVIETRDLAGLSREAEIASVPVPLVSQDDLQKRATLLVVDDSPTILALHRSILRNAGYEVLTAEDGAAAYRILKEHSVQLLLTDIEMPRMSGLDLIRKVRQEPSSKHLPIIVVSQYGSHNDLQKAAEAGADRYMVKSAFDPQKLLETVQELLA